MSIDGNLWWRGGGDISANAAAVSAIVLHKASELMQVSMTTFANVVGLFLAWAFAVVVLFGAAQSITLAT